jgi:hypothetical protein
VGEPKGEKKKRKDEMELGIEVIDGQWKVAMVEGVVAFLEVGTSGGGDGSIVSANIPLAAAATAPTTNAGKLPPPNKASQGPLVTDTNI